LVVHGDDGVMEEIQRPVFDFQNDFAKWLLQNATPVPPEVQRALKRMGYEIRHDRQWAPVPVDGDHRVFVPIDQVEIMPVSGRFFQ
jgi:hypothetical protein